MRRCCVVLLGILIFVPVAAQTFDTPLYINMGGPQFVDSLGRTWLGDEGAGLDPLNIRPDDTGGANVIPAWCTPSADAMAALPGPELLPTVGFSASDAVVFQSIRWDEGAVGAAYILELPVDPGSYTVSLYFCENCCPFRHEKVSIQGEVKFSDVAAGSYAGGATHVPGLLAAEEILVGDDAILRIRLDPCLDPECPGGTDANPVLSALAVVPTDFEPCAQPGFRACPRGLACSIDVAGTVTGTWTPALCIAPTAMEVYQDDGLVATLPGNATGFTAEQTRRVSRYRVVAKGPEGESCPEQVCTVLRPDTAFEVPLRINMGGRRVVDSKGREWLGDGPGTGDPLDIRPDDDLGATNTIELWCARQLIATNEDSLQALGLDPSSLDDQLVFNTIRYDTGDDDQDGLIGEDLDTDGGDVDYRLEIPVPDGAYDLNLFFTECCCPQRHFKVELQGAIVDEDVSSARYSASGANARTGLLEFDDVVVDDGYLKLRLIPCPGCVPEGAPFDPNPLLNALEVLPAGTTTPVCPRELVCTKGLDGQVTCSWMEGEDVAVTGYDVYRDGVKIGAAAADATTFVDPDPLCRRALVYEVVPIIEGASPCPGLNMTSTIIQPDCLFEPPVRINMAGYRVTDSRGLNWLQDIGPGADPLSIRPNDLGGANVAEYWSLGAFQPDSFIPFGLDPEDVADVYIFNTIRWDDGANGVDYTLQIALPRGVYTANLYFNEAGWPGRHFQLLVDGEMVDDDVSHLDYDTENPGLGRLGMIGVAGNAVDDGILEITLRGCLDPVCPGATDRNAILDALEIIAESRINTPPTAAIGVTPEGEIPLSGGEAEATLDGSASGDGDLGSQGLTYAWSKVSGPDGDTIASPAARTTTVRFTAAGTYTYRLVVDDGQPADSTAQAEVEITVLPEGTAFVRGDSDSNGSIELTDGIVTLSYLFLGTGEPACLDAADTDDSGEINLTDAIIVFNWLFLGGLPPVPPTPSVGADYPGDDCGLDTTEDGLGCELAAPVCR